MRRFLSFLCAILAIMLVPALAQAASVSAPDAHALNPVMLLPFLLAGSINDTVSASGSSGNPTWDVVRAELNKMIRDFGYAVLHRPAWQVAAAAVAPPALAIATNTALVQSAATTQLIVNGVPKSLTATDPLILAATWQANDPNTLAIGSVRRWQLCWDATNATTVITMRPSNTKAIASYGSAALALAACRWPGLPPAGTVIVGVVSMTNVTNVFTPGVTALTAAGCTAAYQDGPDANCFEASPVTP